MKQLRKLPYLSVLLIGFAVWLGGRSVVSIAETWIPAVSDEKALPVIVIDPGHGGFDGGAIGISGVVEKDINLAISQKLYDLFIAHGFDVVMTRDADISTEDEGLSTLRKRKNSDLHNRMKTAQSYDDAILLSIHQNKFPQSASFGAQVFYGLQNPESERVGEILQNRLVSMLQPENKRVAKPCGKSVYLVHDAPMPALLIECGFLSNQQDIRKLVDAKYQRQIAFVIFTAICESLELQAPVQM